MTIAERIRQADRNRKTVVDLDICGEKIPVSVKVYTIREFYELIAKFKDDPDETTADFLAKQFTDPETGEQAFTGDDLMSVSLDVWKKLIELLGAVNRGEFEQKKS